ncbi:MAG: hypothetical protein M3R70_08490 [Actinomycetota bacterium]|nr:hypothetical protein [Actinomycetota bacterium]
MRPHIDTLDLALISRLREVVSGKPTTEAEVRRLADQAGGWERTVQAQLDGNERRLGALTSDPSSALAEIADEVRRRDGLVRELDDARALLVGLDDRARELRTAWLKHHAESVRLRPPSSSSRSPARPPEHLTTQRRRRQRP